MDTDTEMLTLEDAKPVVEYEYPTVIASVFRKCRVTDSEDLGGRHKSLIDLYEVFVRFLCIVQLQELRQCIPDLKERLPQKEQTLKFLKRPSTGGWVGLLRILCNLDFEEDKTLWADEIAKWYDESKNSDNREILELLDGIEGVRLEKRTRTPNAEICNALVSYRNKQFAHSASLREQDARKRLPKLERILVYLLQSASFLQELDNIFVERMEVTENDEWLVHAKKLNGTSEEPAHFLTPRKLTLSEVYAARSEDGEIKSEPVSLAPFMLRKINPELKQPDLYVYNDAWRTKLEYLSYGTGAHYYHDELHGGFEELVTLKLRPGVGEDVHRDLSPEERAEYAEDFFKQAKTFASQGRVEDALELFEESIQYERRADTFFEMAKLQQELGDPVDSVRQTLQHCLDVDPANERALALWSRLDEEATQEGTDEADEHHLEKKATTLFHALTPNAFREYAAAWWFMLLFGWYCFSATLEFVAGYGEHSAIVAWLFLVAIPFVVGLVYALSIVERLRLPLSLQLDSMRLERFEEWFDDQKKTIFGAFVFQNDKLQVWKTYAQERFYYAGWAAYAVVFTAAASVFLLPESLDVSPPLAIKRLLDYSFAVVVTYPVVRYIITTTLFVFRYSHLSLKPALTRINDDGVRAFGTLLTYNIFLACLATVLFWVPISFMFELPSYKGDLLLLALNDVLFVAWSVGLPLSIRRAMQESKIKATHSYTTHIEKAFKSFLDDPDEDKLERYEWLQDHQSVIRKISTWPLSWKQTLFGIVGSNLLIIAVNVWYIGVRFGYWTTITERVGSML